MSNYNLYILAFIKVVKSGDLPPEQWANLLIFAETMPTDEEDLYVAIDQWLQDSDRQPILAQWQKITQELSKLTDTELDALLGATIKVKDMGFGGSKPPEKSHSSTGDPTLPEILKNEIYDPKPLNLLDRNSPNQTPNSSDHPKS